MKRLFFALITLILTGFIFIPSTFADEGTMQAANALYENGRYAEAIQAYQQLVNQGSKDANLFYNLGNAYYQTGDLGHAILNYRRAEQIAPRDADIQHNLMLARQQVADQFSQPAENIVGIYLADVTHRLSLNETAVITLALWTVLCLGFLTVRLAAAGRFKTTVKYSLVPLILLFALAAFTLTSRLQMAQDMPEAVIVAEVTDVFSGPGQQFGSDYQLHSGAEITLYQTRGDWAQIGIPASAARGWVTATAVAEVRLGD